MAAGEDDRGEDGVAGEDAEGPVLEEGHDGSGAEVDRKQERSVSIVVHLVHVRASLRDEPLDELEVAEHGWGVQRSPTIVVQLVHVHASLRDEPLDELEPVVPD